MPEYARVATFEADAAALDALVAEIENGEGSPPGVPAKRITVLADRERTQVVVAVRFGSEDDLRQGSETLDAMSPESAGVRRVSVDVFEVLLEREA